MAIASENVHADVGEFQRSYIYKLFIETVPDEIKTKFPEALELAEKIDSYGTQAIFPDRKTEGQKMQWGGEFFFIPTVDSSTKETELEFFEDEPMWVNDFFDALKDYTGSEYNHAIVYGSTRGKFNIGIAKVSVDKETITNYKRLIGVRVYGVTPGDVSKSGTDVCKLKIAIKWDRSKTDKSKRGMIV